MKERILYGWNIRRILYLLIGGAIVVYAITIGEWWAAFAGGYFAAMGLFGFGCASGACGTGSYYTTERKTNPGRTNDISYEEIKGE